MAWRLIPWPGTIEPVDKVSGGSGVHECGLVSGAINGGDEASLEELTLIEIMDENETTSGAGPPDLVKEEVAEAVVDGAITI